MGERKRIVIIGGSSSIAEHCARLWVESSVDLTLVGRDIRRLEQVAADLRVRSPQSMIDTLEAGFVDAAAIRIAVDAAFSRGKIDIALIAHGSLPDQGSCQVDLEVCQKTLEINGISPALYAEAFAARMEKYDHGTVALVGSVAGDRGRKSNYVYGAAKGLIARYAQGLQHRLSGSGVKVVLIKPGPTDTPMTAHLKVEGMRLARVETVARCIVKGIDAGSSVIYAPSKWWLIMLVIQHIPGFIFRKLEI